MSAADHPLAQRDAAASAWTYLGRQLRHPSGLGASVLAPVMALVNRRPNRVAIDALAVAPSDTVLELGFGPGHALRTLIAMASAGRVLGIDHSAAMLARAARRNRAAIGAGRLELRQARFDALPWGAQSVDKILAVNVAYFFGADGADLREARRVLRPGGTMAIYVTERTSMARWAFASAETHRRFDRDELMMLLLRGGFASDEVTIAPIAIPPGIRGLLGIVRSRTRVLAARRGRGRPRRAAPNTTAR